ncbi:MAG: single-stranded-DNA-specific exonuclease RecJ [Acidobacteriota bacterium]
MLGRRGVVTAADAERFLEPKVEHLHDPHEMAGLPEAVQALLDAKARGDKVAIVGDYDVDGVSGTALLAATLRACKLDVLTIVPHRMTDGYGLQPSHVERAVAEGCSLLVTVDCGTTAVAPVSLALESSLRVVVTDHHLPDGPLPAGTILVNPKQEGCRYPCDELSGAGLALKLALAFAEAAGRPIDPLLLLRVACLGTIADLVPLLGENRTIASIGLRELEVTRSPGLRALIDVARVKRPFTGDDVGFRLGPRLNAPGRLDSADKALELLLCRDLGRAKELAADLDAANRERQSWERQASSGAQKLFEETDPLPSILVASNPEWHRGVVGIAAGRIARRFARPTLLLAEDGDSATGSGRSIEGIHLHAFLDRWRDRLEKFGGHAQAVGLTVAKAELPELLAEWRAAAATEWAGKVGVRRYEYEIEMRAAALHRGTVANLEALGPFGQKNRRPLLRVPGPLRLTAPPRHFGQDHIEAQLVDGERGRIRVVGWGWRDRASDLEGSVELLGHLEYDTYRGQTVLRLIDCRPA